MKNLGIFEKFRNFFLGFGKFLFGNFCEFNQELKSLTFFLFLTL